MNKKGESHMKRYDYLLDSSLYISKYFHDKNVCFLDIETTGLSKKFNQIYLIGLVYFNHEYNNWHLSQFFAEHIDEEHILLEQVNKCISNFDLVITYNGEGFDIPFIKYRSKIYKINEIISSIDSFDIYRKIKKDSPYLPFENLKLKTIEESLNIFRDDKYTGKDCINFYYEYINTKDNIFKEKILKHNFDDLYYLLDIMKIFNVIKDIKSVNIEYKEKIITIEIDEITVSGDILRIYCNNEIKKSNINLMYFSNGFNIIWQDENYMILELEINEGFITPTKKCLFVNKSELPLDTNLKDTTDYIVPEDIIVLKIEDKYQMDNIKNIIKQLITHVLYS